MLGSGLYNIIGIIDVQLLKDSIIRVEVIIELEEYNIDSNPLHSIYMYSWSKTMRDMLFKTMWDIIFLLRLAFEFVPASLLSSSQRAQLGCWLILFHQ